MFSSIIQKCYFVFSLFLVSKIFPGVIFFFLQIRVGAHIYPQNPVLHIGSPLNLSIKGVAILNGCC